MGRQLDAMYGDRLRWVGEYTVPGVLVKPLGFFDVHYDKVKTLDGEASCRVTAEFMKRFAHPGIYGLTDPIADNVVYIGRSVDIGKRFWRHLRGDGDTYAGTLKSDKRYWMYDVFESGQKPGLVVLSKMNTAEEEIRCIKAVRPMYNTIQTMKPMSERERFRADAQARKQLAAAEEKALALERLALGRICIKASRREQNGKALTPYELECRQRYKDMLEDKRKRDEARYEELKARGGSDYWRIRK